MQNRDTTVISISTGTIVKGIFILLGFWALWYMRDLALVVITAVVLASAIEPAIKLLGKYRIHRIPAVLLVYLSLTGIFVGMFYIFVPPLLGELSDVSGKLPAFAKELNINFLNTNSDLAKSGQLLVNNVANVSADDFLSVISELTSASENFSTTAGMFFGGFFSFILVVILSFYFAMQEHGIQNFLKIVIPFNKEDYVIDLWERSKEKIGKWMQGQILLAVLIFILVYLGLTIFGIPYALSLALLAGVMELIPVFGPIMSAIPGILVAFGMGGMTLALIIASFYLLVQQFESNLIYPLVVRKVVGVPPILVILALIIGFKLGGFLGVLISVPLAAALMEYIDDLEKRRPVRA